MGGFVFEKKCWLCMHVHKGTWVYLFMNLSFGGGGVMGGGGGGVRWDFQDWLIWRSEDAEAPVRYTTPLYCIVLFCDYL